MKKEKSHVTRSSSKSSGSLLVQPCYVSLPVSGSAKSESDLEKASQQRTRKAVEALGKRRMAISPAKDLNRRTSSRCVDGNVETLTVEGHGNRLQKNNAADISQNLKREHIRTRSSHRQSESEESELDTKSSPGKPIEELCSVLTQSSTASKDPEKGPSVSPSFEDCEKASYTCLKNTAKTSLMVSKDKNGKQGEKKQTLQDITVVEQPSAKKTLKKSSAVNRNIVIDLKSSSQNSYSVDSSCSKIDSVCSSRKTRSSVALPVDNSVDHTVAGDTSNKSTGTKQAEKMEETSSPLGIKKMVRRSHVTNVQCASGIKSRTDKKIESGLNVDSSSICSVDKSKASTRKHVSEVANRSYSLEKNVAQALSDCGTSQCLFASPQASAADDFAASLKKSVKKSLTSVVKDISVHKKLDCDDESQIAIFTELYKMLTQEAEQPVISEKKSMRKSTTPPFGVVDQKSSSQSKGQLSTEICKLSPVSHEQKSVIMLKKTARKSIVSPDCNSSKSNVLVKSEKKELEDGNFSERAEVKKERKSITHSDTSVENKCVQNLVPFIKKNARKSTSCRTLEVEHTSNPLLEFVTTESQKINLEIGEENAATIQKVCVYNSVDHALHNLPRSPKLPLVCMQDILKEEAAGESLENELQTFSDIEMFPFGDCANDCQTDDRSTKKGTKTELSSNLKVKNQKQFNTAAEKSGLKSKSKPGCKQHGLEKSMLEMNRQVHSDISPQNVSKVCQNNPTGKSKDVVPDAVCKGGRKPKANASNLLLERAERRIRSPSIRLKDDMIFFPLVSTRRSKKPNSECNISKQGEKKLSCAQSGGKDLSALTAVQGSSEVSNGEEHVFFLKDPHNKSSVHKVHAFYKRSGNVEKFKLNSARKTLNFSDNVPSCSRKPKCMTEDVTALTPGFSFEGELKKESKVCDNKFNNIGASVEHSASICIAQFDENDVSCIKDKKAEVEVDSISNDEKKNPKLNQLIARVSDYLKYGSPATAVLQDYGDECGVEMVEKHKPRDLSVQQNTMNENFDDDMICVIDTTAKENGVYYIREDGSLTTSPTSVFPRVLKNETRESSQGSSGRPSNLGDKIESTCLSKENFTVDFHNDLPGCKVNFIDLSGGKFQEDCPVLLNNQLMKSKNFLQVSQTLAEGANEHCSKLASNVEQGALSEGSASLTSSPTKVALKIKKPAPLSVLSRPELMSSPKPMSAFISDALDKYLAENQEFRICEKSQASTCVSDFEADDFNSGTSYADRSSQFALPPHTTVGLNCNKSPMHSERKMFVSEPDFDEIDGILFISFPTEEALQAHIRVEKKAKWDQNFNELSGISKLKIFNERKHEMGGRKLSKFVFNTNQNLRGLHMRLKKYERLYRKELSSIHMAKRKKKKAAYFLSRSPDKMRNVRKLSGWKRKPLKREEFKKVAGFQMMQSGKLHWRTEARILKNLNPEDIKQMGLQIKKKRRKNFIFTHRKGCAKFDVSRCADDEPGSCNGLSICNQQTRDKPSPPFVISMSEENGNTFTFIPNDNDSDDDYKPCRRMKRKHKKPAEPVDPKELCKTIYEEEVALESEEILRKLGGQFLEGMHSILDESQSTTESKKIAEVSESGIDERLGVANGKKHRKNIIPITILTQSMAIAAVSAIDYQFSHSEPWASREVSAKDSPAGQTDKVTECPGLKADDTSISPEVKVKPYCIAPESLSKILARRKIQATNGQCDKPGCRYGCICHLCWISESIDDTARTSTATKSCEKEYCRLGCICDSIDGNKKKYGHCGKLECMFTCRCHLMLSASTTTVPFQTLQNIPAGPGMSGHKAESNQIQTFGSKGTGETIYTASVKEEPLIKLATSNNGTELAAFTSKGDQALAQKEKKQKKDKYALLPRRESSHRQAKGLDAVSRKALMFYETSEIFHEKKEKRRKVPSVLSKGETAKQARAEVPKLATVMPPRIKYRQCVKKYNCVQEDPPFLQSKPGVNGDEVEEDNVDFKICRIDTCSVPDTGAISTVSTTLTCARTIAFVPDTKRKVQCAYIKKKQQQPASEKLLHESTGKTLISVASETSRPITPSGATSEKNLMEDGYVNVTEVAVPSPGSGEKDGQSSKSGQPVYEQDSSTWHVQMICLKSNIKVKPVGSQEPKEDHQLLEFISNCNWDCAKSDIICKVSLCLYPGQYPSPRRMEVGNFIVDILPKADKPAIIPSEFQTKLPDDMYSVRIRVIEKSKWRLEKAESLSNNFLAAESSNSTEASMPIHPMGISGLTQLHINHTPRSFSINQPSVSKNETMKISSNVNVTTFQNNKNTVKGLEEKTTNLVMSDTQQSINDQMFGSTSQIDCLSLQSQSNQNIQSPATSLIASSLLRKSRRNSAPTPSAVNSQTDLNTASGNSDMQSDSLKIKEEKMSVLGPLNISNLQNLHFIPAHSNSVSLSNSVNKSSILHLLPSLANKKSKQQGPDLIALPVKLAPFSVPGMENHQHNVPRSHPNDANKKDRACLVPSVTCQQQGFPAKDPQPTGSTASSSNSQPMFVPLSGSVTSIPSCLQGHLLFSRVQCNNTVMVPYNILNLPKMTTQTQSQITPEQGLNGPEFGTLQPSQSIGSLLNSEVAAVDSDKDGKIGNLHGNFSEAPVQKCGENCQDIQINENKRKSSLGESGTAEEASAACNNVVGDFKPAEKRRKCDHDQANLSQDNIGEDSNYSVLSKNDNLDACHTLEMERGENDLEIISLDADVNSHLKKTEKNECLPNCQSSTSLETFPVKVLDTTCQAQQLVDSQKTICTESNSSCSLSADQKLSGGSTGSESSNLEKAVDLEDDSDGIDVTCCSEDNCIDDETDCENITKEDEVGLRHLCLSKMNSSLNPKHGACLAYKKKKKRKSPFCEKHFGNMDMEFIDDLMYADEPYRSCSNRSLHTFRERVRRHDITYHFSVVQQTLYANSKSKFRSKILSKQYILDKACKEIKHLQAEEQILIKTKQKLIEYHEKLLACRSLTEEISDEHESQMMDHDEMVSDCASPSCYHWQDDKNNDRKHPEAQNKCSLRYVLASGYLDDIIMDTSDIKQEMSSHTGLQTHNSLTDDSPVIFLSDKSDTHQEITKMENTHTDLAWTACKLMPMGTDEAEKKLEDTQFLDTLTIDSVFSLV